MHPQTKIVAETADGLIRAIVVDANGALLGGSTSDSTAANQTTQINRLVEIRDQLILVAGQTDTLESLATALNGYVDGLETLITNSNTTSTAISGFVDALSGYTDGIETNQATEITRLVEIRDRLPASGTSQSVSVSNLPATQPISATALPLPSGAAEATNQLSAINRLVEIRDQLILVAGQTDTLESLATALNGYVDSLETLITNSNTTSTAISGFVDALEGYTDGIETNQATEITRLTEVRDRLPATVGVKTSALSLPVTLSSDGAFATNFGATSDGAATSDTGNFSFLGFVKRILSAKLRQGSNSSVDSLSVSLSNDGPFSTNFGSVDSTAATTDTGSGNLIGLFKRLLSAKLPSALVRDRLKTDSLVRTMSRKLREDFALQALDSGVWQVLQTGAGQTISVSNSILTIASGTTTLSETIIRSVETFTIPFRTAFIANLSQRIANQEFYLEIVDPSGLHYASWQFDGTIATSAKVFAANSGLSSGITSPTTFSTATNQIFEIETTPDEVYFYMKFVDSNVFRANPVIRNRQIPDPNLQYHLQVRVKNLATAPASSTTFNIDAITVQDIEELSVEVTGGRGGGASNQAIPVTAPVALAVTNVSNSLLVNDGVASTTETAVALAANGVYGGVSRDSSNNKNLVRGWVFTDVPGTLIFDQSIAGTVFRQTDSISISGNTTQASRYEFKVAAKFYRIRYVNGATAQLTLELISAAVNIGA